MKPLRIVGIGILLLLVGAVLALLSTSSRVSEVNATSTITYKEYGDLAYLLNMGEGRILNGTLTLYNIGDSEILIFIGPFEEPKVLRLGSNKSVETSVYSGYDLKITPLNGSNGVVRLEFQGFVEEYPLGWVVALSLLSFITGTVVSTVGLLLYMLGRGL
ncbi:MAG: hypothetical protein GSR86_05215 [Desulfurococcales archaeon]|nr:hypothetical protein [Desulfurococcales archaeon]